MKKKALFLWLALCFSNVVLSQSSLTIPSPNVAALSQQAIYPISDFNGQANVSIPIGDVSYKEINIPVLINYNTQGNIVKNHAGFVGLGWNLASGGTVFRKVNGISDEHPKRLANVEYSSEINYINSLDKVSSGYNNINALKKYALDGQNVPLMDYVFDGMPDEFIFNFGNYSGRFYITKNRSGVLATSISPNGDYSLKAEIVEIKENLTFDNVVSPGVTSLSLKCPRTIYKIKITDDKGMIYIFGGSNESIEFGNSGNLNDDNFNVSTAWHLTQVISPDGYAVNLNYERGGQLIIPSKFRDVLMTSGTYKFSNYAHFILAFSVTFGNGSYSYSGISEGSSYYFNYPSYLKSIKTPLGTTEFFYSNNNDLQYDYSKFNNPTLDQILQYKYPNNLNLKKSNWRKLDKIVLNNGQRTADFFYKENASTRLSLDSLKTSNEIVYKFGYNSQTLPNYESKQEDHWGYYNGRSYEYTSDYYNSREANPLYLQAEMLISIINSTGGYTKLEYEPHYYKKIAQQFPFIVKDSSNNLIAGGLRVKSIETKDALLGGAFKREFYYVHDYIHGGLVSSGILSGLPKYSNSGSRFSSYKSGGFWSGNSSSSSLYYQRAKDNNLYPLSSTNGNHVTYSEVTEKNDQGFFVKFYTNHDNGYHDIAPPLMHSNYNSAYFEDPFISKQVYRGLMLKTKIYSLSKDLKQEIEKIYDIDTILAASSLASEEAVPFMQRVGESSVNGWRASSGRYLITPPLIKKEIIRNFKNNVTESTQEKSYGRNYIYVSTNQDWVNPGGDYTYYKDFYNPTSISYSDSKGVSYTMVYFYPSQLNSISFVTEADQTIRSMLANRILDSPFSITKIRFPGSNVTPLPPNWDGTWYDDWYSYLYDQQLFRYKKVNNTVKLNKAYSMASVKPIKFKTTSDATDFRFVVDSVYGYLDVSTNPIQYVYKDTTVYRAEGRVTSEVLEFNTSGDPVEIRRNEGPSTVYIWGYGGQYILAEVKNATYAEVEKVLTKPVINELNSLTVSDATISAAITKLRTDGRLSKTMVSSYTYKPLIGMTSKTDPSGVSEYYEYDGLQRLRAILDQAKNVTNSIHYHYRPN